MVFWHNCAIEPMLWLTKSTVLPSLPTDFIFFGVGTVTQDILIGGFLASLLLLVSGLLIFNRVQRTFVDTI